jgi:hypothetical protein
MTHGGFNFELAKKAVISNQKLFDIQIGCALGGREKSAGLWIRNYSRGLVLVNTDHLPRIFATPKKNYTDVNGIGIDRSFVINPFEGKILIEKQ